MDLEALVTDELRDAVPAYTLEWFDVEASSRRPPHATVAVRTPDGDDVEGSFTGDGPVDAIFRAINAATGIDARLREFRVGAVPAGRTRSARSSVVLEFAGRRRPGRASRPTSSRRRRSPTCARCLTWCAAHRRPSRSPVGQPPAPS